LLTPLAPLEGVTETTLGAVVSAMGGTGAGVWPPPQDVRARLIETTAARLNRVFFMVFLLEAARAGGFRCSRMGLELPFAYEHRIEKGVLKRS